MKYVVQQLCRYLGNLICVEGIVTRVSLVRPKVVRSVHYCPATKKVMERKYTDLTSFEAFPTTAVYPTKVRRYSCNKSQ